MDGPPARTKPYATAKDPINRRVSLIVEYLVKPPGDDDAPRAVAEGAPGAASAKLPDENTAGAKPGAAAVPVPAAAAPASETPTAK
jgi:hypothetical protein